MDLVSISEAARRLGRDPRTVRKITDLAEIKVKTRTGNLYDLAELEALIKRAPITVSHSRNSVTWMAPR